MPIRHANSELAAIAWLKAQNDLPTNSIGTTLPHAGPRAAEGPTAPTWASTGFIQVITTGATKSARNHPYRAPVITAHCWAVNPNKQTPPWGMACDLAEEIWQCCLIEGNGRENLSLPVSGAPRIRVLQVWGIQEPKRIPWGFPSGQGSFINPGNTAHYTVDFQIAWAELPS